VGHKTLLDVLDPVRRLLAEAPLGESTATLIARVRQCAFDSADATAGMQAIKGRASFLGERADGHVDPGSRSMALIIGAVCDTLAA
jgi:phosphoenolpyruvate---glycerone phosphotransferase subunit DhaL